MFPSFGTKGLKLFASSASADEENWFCGRPKDKATKQEQRIELIKAFILFLLLQILTFFQVNETVIRQQTPQTYLWLSCFFHFFRKGKRQKIFFIVSLYLRIVPAYRNDCIDFKMFFVTLVLTCVRCVR